MDPTPFVRACNLTDVEKTGRGLGCTVYRATSPTSGTVALRIPRTTTVANVNDLNQDTRALLAQELAIYRYLGTFTTAINSSSPTAPSSSSSSSSSFSRPVPVPEPIALLDSANGQSAMLASFIEADDAPVPAAELGRILGQLHSLPPPPAEVLVPIAHEGCATALEVVASRLPRRYAELRRREPSLPALPSAATLAEQLAPLSRFPSRLLHMDFRVANLRAQRGRVMAVVDWENAMVGPAAIDLLRVLEIADPGGDFLQAYGGGVPDLQPGEDTVLRLDAAVMLALVFLSEAPDAELAKVRVARVRELVDQLEWTRD